MTKPKRNPRILISGAGIAGPSLAFRLLRHGFEPTLIERAPSFRESGYMIDVWGLGYDLLERFGLLEKARERAYVFDRLTIVDDHDKEIARFGGEVFRRALLGRFFSIPRGDLGARSMIPSRAKSKRFTVQAFAPYTTIPAVSTPNWSMAARGVSISLWARKVFALICVNSHLARRRNSSTIWAIARHRS